MSWIKLDDGFAEHVKVSDLSDRAFRVHVRALCYTARRNSDGQIPRLELAALRGTSRHAAELVSAGLWEKTDRGWQIHDYLEYNRSASEIADKRAEARGRMKDLRASRGARELLSAQEARAAAHERLSAPVRSNGMVGS